MDVRVERTGGLLRVEITGSMELGEFLAFIQSTAPQTREHGDRLVLVNLLGLAADLNLTGHLLLGKYVAEHLPHVSKLASVVPADKITRISEKAARAQGMQLSVFESETAALAWLMAGEPAGVPVPVRGDEPLLDPIRSAFWEAFRHLFPPHAQAIQLANGSLAISWGMANHPDALYGMSAPITVRFEPALIDSMRLASAEQRKRIATHQEAAFRAGMLGYDPYAAVPKARVIVLG
ncbi:MAG: STAS/SEC14 domain-containing protein [Ramlibacter sp.]|jgi:hypothetical protein